jgi:cytoskeleton protein RodZ
MLMKPTSDRKKGQVLFRRMQRFQPSPRSFGEELKRDRLLREVSLEEISAATKISMRLLTARESSNLAKLPAPVFTRGFIRAYSLHLGLDPVQKINAYLEEIQPNAAPLPASVAKPRGGSRFLRGPRSTAGTILGGVTATLLVLGLIARPEHRRDSAARLSRASLVEPVSFKNVAPSNEPTPLIREDVPESSIVAVGMALVLEFDEPSWVEISADGTKVFGGLVAAGMSRRFEARSEFRVTLGNAGGVRVSLDGHPAARLGRSGEVVRDVRLPDLPARG